MRKLLRFAVPAAGMLLLTGCLIRGPYPQGGLIYHSVKGPNHAELGPAGTKTAQTCATDLLGLYAWGDASIATAKKEAKISAVTAVDYDSFNVLGVYVKTCTIVSGT